MIYRRLKILFAEALNDILSECYDALKLNCKVCIISKDPIISEVLLSLMKDRNINVKKFEKNESSNICLVNDISDILGSGYVYFTVPETLSILNCFDKLIDEILRFHNMKVFKGFFNSNVNEILKKILINNNLAHLIDAVINFAYYSGIVGDEVRALSFINDLYFENSSHPKKITLYNSKSVMLEDAFECLFQAGLTSPHDLKAVISYFLVKKRNLNYSKASKILKISRTTLHEYIRKAKNCDLNEDFFKKSF